MWSRRKFALMFACGAASLYPKRQQAQDKTVLINFILPVNTETANRLLSIVNQQIKTGATRITLLISSPGGDTPSALAAFNVLRSLPVELTTFNIGNVDSAAMILYCAGRKRFSLPGPGTRFLIHGNRITFGTGVALDATGIEAQIQQLKSLNQMVSQVLSAVAPSKVKEIDAAIREQAILTPEEAREWGIVQDIRTEFMEPGATLIAVSEPGSPEGQPPPDAWRFSSEPVQASTPTQD